MKVQNLTPYNIYTRTTQKNTNSPDFTGMVNLSKIEKNLDEIRQNDFISGIYFNDSFSIHRSDYKRGRINFFANNMKSFDTINLFDGKNDDAAFKFAALIKKLNSQNKDTFIINKVPELFRGIQLNKIRETLDTLSYHIRQNKSLINETDSYIELNGKRIDFEYIGSGENSTVFKLWDKEGNETAMKTYIKPEEISSYSIFGELAVYHALKDEKICNIPELYFANPLIKQVEDKSQFPTEIYEDMILYEKGVKYDEHGNISVATQFKDYDGYKGGWTIVEYIGPYSYPKHEGIMLHEWLKRNNLKHHDISIDNVKNGYITDLGGIER